MDENDRRDLPRKIDRENTRDATVRLVLAVVGLVILVGALAYLFWPVIMRVGHHHG